jgi:outer membrane protein assembly factor BamB
MSVATGDTTNLSHSNVADVPGIRLWPAVFIVVAMWVLRTLSFVGEFQPLKFMIGYMLGPLVATLALHIWYFFAVRRRSVRPYLELCLFLAIATITILVAEKNLRQMALIIYGLPAVATAWVVMLIIMRIRGLNGQRVGVVISYVGVAIWLSILRFDGLDGEFAPKLSFRWTPTGETAFLKKNAAIISGAGGSATPSTRQLVDTPLTLKPGDWPGFRGPNRDGKATEIKLTQHFDMTRPTPCWQQGIGPGWSSFAIVGDFLFTQEQRGNDECVVCYHALTGAQVWSHTDVTRFEEPIAGAGPRATPTFDNGDVYTLGANGRLNRINAETGKVVWGIDIIDPVAEKALIPIWGFSSSPLVSHGLVSVFVGAGPEKTLIAYNKEDGKVAWTAGETGVTADAKSMSYSSPQLVKLDGVEQILMSTNFGLFSVDPEKGTKLWEYKWKSEMVRVVQPTILSDTELLYSTPMSGGTHRLRVKREGDEWKIDVVWKAPKFKPYFNDLIVSKNHAFGFDSNFFACLDLSDGSIKWKTRDYGSGQVLLFANDRNILVLSETGEAVVLEMSLDKPMEIGKTKVL